MRRSVADLRLQKPANLRSRVGGPVDTSDVPEVELGGSGESHRIRKRSVTLRLDEDVVEFFRSQGAGYQTRINRVLRGAVYPPKSLGEQLKTAAELLDELARRAG